MSQLRRPVPLVRRRFPRVSGDEPRADGLHDTGDEFSPRERG